MSRRLLLGGFSLLAVASAAQAGSIDLNVNDDAARLVFGWPVAGDKLKLDAAWMHHDDNGDVASFGFHVAGEVTSSAAAPVAGIGAKFLFLDAEEKDVDGSALALGGFLRFPIPGHTRLRLEARAYFAPEVTSFGGTDDYVVAGARASYGIVGDAEVYLGYRYANADFDNDVEVTFDTGLHFGFRIEF